MAEVPKQPQLGVFGRGSHERIDVFPHEGGLTSNYSGNVVDICPVGALLSRDFRFRARAWFLSTAPTLCTGCSKGCSTHVDFLGQDVYRYRPRENDAINQSWMCDQGRLTYKGLNKHRLLQAVLGTGADGREAHTQEAAKVAAAKVKEYVGRFAVLVSPTVSNEDLLAALTFGRDVLKASAFYVTGRPSGEADTLLMSADKNPNRKGLEWVARGLGITLLDFAALQSALDEGKHPALYAFGSETPEEAEAFAKRLAKVSLFALQATMDSAPITQAAHLALPASSHVEDEGTFTNHDGITQRVRRAFPPRGEAQPHWKWTAAIAAELGHTVGYASAREVFRTFAPLVPELKDFKWDALAPMNQKGRGVASLPSSADGRPPGYRELGIPRVRGI
jgi:NADH-quinone oxidoreductase subunit G